MYHLRIYDTTKIPNFFSLGAFNNFFFELNSSMHGFSISKIKINKIHFFGKISNFYLLWVNKYYMFREIID